MCVLEIITKENEREIYQKYASSPFPFNVIGFGKELGLKLRESTDLSDSISGFIKKENDNIYICVNSRHSENRKRFTVAHELGHYFLHNEELSDGFVDNILKREKTINNKKELDANNFAANLLMPEELFKDLWLREDRSISAIATMFFVSESAILTRAKYLGLTKGYDGYFV